MREATEALGAEIVRATRRRVCPDLALLIAFYAREGRFRVEVPDPTPARLDRWSVRGAHMVAGSFSFSGKCTVWIHSRGASKTARLVLSTVSTRRLSYLVHLVDDRFLVLQTFSSFSSSAVAHVVSAAGVLEATWEQSFSEGCWWGEACLLVSSLGRQELAVPGLLGIQLLDAETGGKLGALPFRVEVENRYFKSASDDLILAHYIPHASFPGPPRVYSRASNHVFEWTVATNAQLVVIPHLRLVRFFSCSCHAGDVTDRDLTTGTVLRRWRVPAECGMPESARGSKQCGLSTRQLIAVDPLTGITYSYSKSHDKSADIVLWAQLP